MTLWLLQLPAKRQECLLRLNNKQSPYLDVSNLGGYVGEAGKKLSAVKYHIGIILLSYQISMYK